MYRFRKLGEAVWHCKYHIVLVPQRQFRAMTGSVRCAVYDAFQRVCLALECDTISIDVRREHVRIVVYIPPRMSVSELVAHLKKQSSTRLFKQFKKLKAKPYWEDDFFWTSGYCVDTDELEPRVIQQYIRYQEEHERHMETMRTCLDHAAGEDSPFTLKEKQQAKSVKPSEGGELDDDMRPPFSY